MVFSEESNKELQKVNEKVLQATEVVGEIIQKAQKKRGKKKQKTILKSKDPLNTIYEKDELEEEKVP